jgi:hypothetical protein
MTYNLALSLLSQGNDGDEILSILESIAADDSNDPAPTLEEVQF